MAWFNLTAIMLGALALELYNRIFKETSFAVKGIFYIGKKEPGSLQTLVPPPLSPKAVLFMIGFCPLASGSKGNCTYLGTSQTRVLIDAGITCRQICLRLESLEIEPESIDAILITHEHSDHCKGIDVFCRKYDCPVYANAETAKALLDTYPDLPHLKIFDTGSDFSIKDISFHPFRVQHDAVDPVMFTMRCLDMKLALCTDLGFATTLVRAHLTDCDYLIVEANHKPDMVHACPRPPSYKQRVLSRSGHLSNDACGELLAAVACSKLKRVYLGHLSSECNSVTTAIQEVRAGLAPTGLQPEIYIAYQDNPSEPLIFSPEPSTIP